MSDGRTVWWPKDSAWWRREVKGLYAPIIHLRGPEDADAPPETAHDQ